MQEIPFPDWVPSEVIQEARGLDQNAAASAIGQWLREQYLGSKANAS